MNDSYPQDRTDYVLSSDFMKMLPSRRQMSYLGAISYLIAIFSILLMQTTGGTVTSFVLVWVYICIIFMSILKRGKIQITTALLFIAAGCFVIFQVRPDAIVEGLGYWDVMFLLPIIFGLAFGQYSPRLNRILLYKSVAFGSLFLLSLNIHFYSISFYPSFLVEEPYAGIRWVGGMNGPNEFAQVYVSIFALVLGLRLEREISNTTVFLFASICAYGVFITFSRGGLISYLFIIIVFGILLERKILVVVTGFSALTVAWLAGADLLLISAVQDFNTVRANASDRSEIFGHVQSMFEDNPLFGGGFGSFALTSPSAQTPHSDYIYFLTSGGLVGFLILFAVILYVIWIFFRARLFSEALFFLTVAANGVFWNNLVRGKLSILVFFVLVIGLRLLAYRREVGRVG